MATYTELYSLMSGQSELKNKITVAVIVAAESIRNEDVGTTNHANRLIWASQAFLSPSSMAEKMLMAVLASNKDQTVSTINSASDEILQTCVNNVIDIFATG